jgi:hypothetical protein
MVTEKSAAALGALVFGCLAILMATANVGFAMGSSGGGGLPGGGFSCSYRDAGFEEHFGGHGSCGSCLKAHGECNEECSATSYACTASGASTAGAVATSEGYSDYSENDARERALDRCAMSGNKNCVVSDCEQRQKLVSSRSCKH